MIESDFPPYREFRYFTMVVGDDAECMALLTQVMNSYPLANHKAITAWFSKVYGQEKISNTV